MLHSDFEESAQLGGKGGGGPSQMVHLPPAALMDSPLAQPAGTRFHQDEEACTRKPTSAQTTECRICVCWISVQHLQSSQSDKSMTSSSVIQSSVTLS